MPDSEVIDPELIDRQLAGLDALELADTDHRSRRARVWSATWPKAAAIGLGLFIWQVVVWTGWKKEYILPGPGRVLGELWHLLASGEFTRSEVLPATLTRAVVGFLLAVVVGVALGAAMSRIKLLYAAA